MGALDIRPASAQLNNLGQFRMPELDDGSARFWQSQASAAERSAAAARTAGMAAVEGISRRGQIVANTLQHLGRLAFEFADRENDRIANEAVLELRRRTNEEMYGNGQNKVGRLNENIADVGAWVQSVREWNGTTVQDLEKDMSGKQRELFHQRIADQQLGLQTMVAQHAAKTSLAKQRTTAAAISADALNTAASSFGDRNSMDVCVKAFVGAKLHELEIADVPEEAKPAIMRTEMRNLLSKGWDYAIASFSATLANRAETREDSVATRKAWDEWAKEAEAAQYMLSQEDVKRFMPDGLADTEKELFRQRIREGGFKACDRARATFAENARAMGEKFDDLEKRQMAEPSGYGYVEALEKWAKDEDGSLAKYDPERRNRYATYAKAIREAEANGMDASFLKTLPSNKALEKSLADSAHSLSLARAGGRSPSEVQKIQMEALQKYQLAIRYGLVDPTFQTSFERIIKGALKDQTVRALKEWYSQWGIHPQTDDNGRATAGERKSATGKVLVPTGPGEDGMNGAIDKLKFFAMTDELIGAIESEPDRFNREESVNALISKIRTDGLAAAYDAEANAAKEVLDIIQKNRADIDAAEIYRRVTSVPGVERETPEGAADLGPTDPEIERRRAIGRKVNDRLSEQKKADEAKKAKEKRAEDLRQIMYQRGGMIPF